jgi:opacity protein-like surface antigen
VLGVAEHVLFYGKGGFALSTIESTIVDTRGALTGTGEKDIFGWAWGGGLAYAFIAV